jgi:hypothetical protein
VFYFWHSAKSFFVECFFDTQQSVLFKLHRVSSMILISLSYAIKVARDMIRGANNFVVLLLGVDLIGACWRQRHWWFILVWIVHPVLILDGGVADLAADLAPRTRAIATMITGSVVMGGWERPLEGTWASRGWIRTTIFFYWPKPLNFLLNKTCG